MENRKPLSLFGNSTSAAKTPTLAPKLTALIEKYKTSGSDITALNAKYYELMQTQANEFNPLIMKLADAYVMLKCIPAAVESSMKVLRDMTQLATSAMDGSNSEEDMKNLDNEYRYLKRVLPYMQTVTTNNGLKLLSEGDVTIQLSADNYITIELAAFDIDSLGLTNTKILTGADASKAMTKLNDALTTLSSNLLTKPRLDSAIDGILFIPTILSFAYKKLVNLQAIAMQAVNGSTSYQDLPGYNYNYHIEIDALNMYQSIPTLNGYLRIGEGALNIQIGKKSIGINNLTINLPVTDAEKLKLDSIDLTDTADNGASNALSILAQAINDMVYEASKAQISLVNKPIDIEQPRPRMHK